MLCDDCSAPNKKSRANREDREVDERCAVYLTCKFNIKFINMNMNMNENNGTKQRHGTEKRELNLF